MKLLIATGLYPPDMGGPATYTVFLEKHLPQHGIACVVLPYGTVRKYPKILRHAVYTAKLVWRARSVDVLYALDTVSVGLPVRIASFITRTPYMLRVPGDYAWEQGQQRFGITEVLDVYAKNPHRPWAVRVLAAIQKHVAQHASHIVVPSEYLKYIVMGWGIDGAKITRIYSALKHIEVSESKEALRSQFGYTTWTLVTAGRLVPWKGVHALLDVVKRLHDEGVDVRLEVLGDGTCRAELEAYAVTLGIASLVGFRGVLSRDEMAKRVKASDVFVLNTSYEGLSHQLIEVMSLGTPIVTTRVGGNPELITDGETGVLVPYNDAEKIHDALIWCRDSQAHVRGYTDAAKLRTALFHEDVVVQEFIRLMRTVWKF